MIFAICYGLFHVHTDLCRNTNNILKIEIESKAKEITAMSSTPTTQISPPVSPVLDKPSLENIVVVKDFAVVLE